MTNLPDGAWVLRDLAVHPTTDRIRLRIGGQSIDLTPVEADELAGHLWFLSDTLTGSPDSRSEQPGSLDRADGSTSALGGKESEPATYAAEGSNHTDGIRA